MAFLCQGKSFICQSRHEGGFLTISYSMFHVLGKCRKVLKDVFALEWLGIEENPDLSELLDLCIDCDDSFEHLFPECELLNEYITEARYPGDLLFENINKKEAKEAIEAADKIANYVLKNTHLPSDDENSRLSRQGSNQDP